MSMVKVDDIAIRIVALEIARHRPLFGEYSVREDFEGSPHKDTESIYLRMPPGIFDWDNPVLIKSEFQNSLEAEDTDLYSLFPCVRSVVTSLAAKVSAERIGRVVIVSLAGLSQIDAHRDEGDMPEYYDRFHISVTTTGTVFTCGDEEVYMKPGEIWWIDNQEEHSVDNESEDERIHIIVDLKLQES